MADKIHDALVQIQQQIRALERELDRLRTAADVLEKLETGQETLRINEGGQKPRGITEAVRKALHDLGGADTGTVIRYVQRNFIPNANKNSIRSILSVGKKKGEFIRKGSKYQLAEAEGDSES